MNNDSPFSAARAALLHREGLMIGFGLATRGLDLRKPTRYRTSFIHPLHDVYSSMKNRCLNPRNAAWNDYGGRGITICARWLEKKPIGQGFRNFRADMGERPIAYTLERINNDGNYEPSNCRWASRADQYANRRSNVFLEFNGERKTLSQWADALGIPYTTVCNRYGDGLSTAEVLDTRILWGKGKTHCKQGHAFNAANTYVDRRGSRHCRTCGREVMRRLRLKEKG